MRPSRQAGRSSIALTLVLVSALAALGGLAWLVRPETNPSSPRRGSGAESSGSVRIPEQLDSIAGSAHEDAPVADVQRSSSAGSSAAGLPATARIRASSRDARSGAAIPGMRLVLVEEAAAPAIARIAYARADAEGVIERDDFPSGRWRISASSSRHRTLVLGTFETKPGEMLLLGRITLEPLPVHRGRLLDESGGPAFGQWITLPSKNAAGEELDPAVTNDAGEFEVIGDLPAFLVLQVNPTGPLRDLEGQRFALDQWPLDQQLDLRLAPYQHVIVGIYGGLAESGDLRVLVRPAPEPQTDFSRPYIAEPAEYKPLLRAREVRFDGETRRFEFYVPAGRFAVWGESRSGILATTKFTVVEGSADSEFLLRAR